MYRERESGDGKARKDEEKERRKIKRGMEEGERGNKGERWNDSGSGREFKQLSMGDEEGEGGEGGDGWEKKNTGLNEGVTRDRDSEGE